MLTPWVLMKNFWAYFRIPTVQLERKGMDTKDFTAL